MLKLIPTIFALCLCVALTAAMPPARAADDAKAKDKIKLPAFHKQTVKIDGKDVPIEVRWFEQSFTIGTTKVDTLPACASKTMIIAHRYLLDKNYKAFVSLNVEKKRAQMLVDYAKKRAKKDTAQEQEKLMSSERHTTILGEVRLGAYYMVVCDFHEPKPPTIGSMFLIRTEGGFLMASSTYYAHKNKAKQPDVKQILAVESLIRQGTISPPVHSSNE